MPDLVQYYNQSQQFIANGSGDPYTATLDPSSAFPTGATQVGDVLLLAAGGRYTYSTGDAITVDGSFTLLANYSDAEDTGSARGHRLAVWGKIATASDIADGVDIEFDTSFGGVFNNSRCAILFTYRTSTGLAVNAGPAYSNILESDAPDTLVFPNPNPSSFTTVITAGMGRFTSGGWPGIRNGFTRRTYITPQGNYSMVFLDRESESPPSAMPEQLVPSASAALSFALTGRAAAVTIGHKFLDP